MRTDTGRETEKIVPVPQHAMTFEMAPADLAAAVEYYLNEVLLDVPVYVTTVKALGLSKGGAFSIVFERRVKDSDFEQVNDASD